MSSLTTLLTDIARRHLSIETLVTRNSDSLDFHTVSVWGVEAALREAYEQGAKDLAGQRQQQRKRGGFGRLAATLPPPWNAMNVTRIAA